MSKVPLQYYPIFPIAEFGGFQLQYHWISDITGAEPHGRPWWPFPENAQTRPAWQTRGYDDPDLAAQLAELGYGPGRTYTDAQLQKMAYANIILNMCSQLWLFDRATRKVPRPWLEDDNNEVFSPVGTLKSFVETFQKIAMWTRPLPGLLYCGFQLWPVFNGNQLDTLHNWQTFMEGPGGANWNNFAYTNFTAGTVPSLNDFYYLWMAFLATPPVLDCIRIYYPATGTLDKFVNIVADIPEAIQRRALAIEKMMRLNPPLDYFNNHDCLPTEIPLVPSPYQYLDDNGRTSLRAQDFLRISPENNAENFGKFLSYVVAVGSNITINNSTYGGTNCKAVNAGFVFDGTTDPPSCPYRTNIPSNVTKYAVYCRCVEDNKSKGVVDETCGTCQGGVVSGAQFANNTCYAANGCAGDKDFYPGADGMTDCCNANKGAKGCTGGDKVPGYVWNEKDQKCEYVADCAGVPNCNMKCCDEHPGATGCDKSYYQYVDNNCTQVASCDKANGDCYEDKGACCDKHPSCPACETKISPWVWVGVGVGGLLLLVLLFVAAFKIRKARLSGAQ